MLTADDFYTDAERDLQAAHDSRSLADVVVQAIVRDEMEPPNIDFIASRDFFFLSTVNDRGEPTVSYKGGAPGFVKVLDANTLVFPNFDGNGMFKSMGNIASMTKIGMLFIDMETPNRVRVQGEATLSTDPADLALYPGANMVVKVTVTSCFLNCARYIHKHTRVEASPYVPDAQGDQPYPAWKRIDMVQDALPEKDRGKADAHGGTITMDGYVERLMAGTS
ncbi:pyridoxamine 5'-phosphate oxidase family protein [Chachezhania sediminis]|uniref:pyridoxamine 5'-phosphate oxidase family protein n=1 Tax=Chachezhania sediminis TaxID=2599291 RepID=UPI00131BCE1D|nr:pyridoxamine 5'-phosphate oxidase family protein [Chachezhania sediminis]